MIDRSESTLVHTVECLAQLKNRSLQLNIELVQAPTPLLQNIVAPAKQLSVCSDFKELPNAKTQAGAKTAREIIAYCQFINIAACTHRTASATPSIVVFLFNVP